MSSKADELRAKLIRNFDEVLLTRETREPLYDGRGARLARGTAALKLGASIDILEPGKRGCPYHLHHAQEEMFIVLQGHGTMRVAGEMLAVKAGDVIFTPPGPDYPHQMINTSDAPLKYLSISTKDVPEVVEYPDSNKVLTNARVAGNDFGFARMNTRDTDLDYWHDEP
ncbi:MAG TPA: cupin domain-containing protein [Burkholderiaceae bacterium]